MNKDINMNRYLELIKDQLIIDDIKYIVEVGSLDGADSMFFKNHFPLSTVYTIEGLPENYNKYLKDNKDIQTFNIVISDYIGNVNYYVKNINGLHGIYNRGDNYGTETIQLPCITLDKFCEDNNIPQIDILKIDVEGATLDVLKGMGNILPNIKIMHIETETYPFFDGQSLHDDVEDYLIRENFNKIEMTKCEILKNKYQCDSVWVNQKI